MTRECEFKADATTVGLRSVVSVLPPCSVELEDLADQGLLRSSPSTLSDFGFRRAYLADRKHDAGWLALEAARSTLQEANLDAEEIDVLIWASALAHNHLRDAPGEIRQRLNPESLMKSFRYASGWLQEELGLNRAEVTAVAQQGCASMFSALRLARSLLVAEPQLSNVLCIGVDVLPQGAPREILYNVISDAACAVIASKGWPQDRWIGYRQISKGYYWDPLEKQDEILAAYFPTSRLAIEELLAKHGLLPADVDVVVPTGVQRESWDILLRLVGIPSGRLFKVRESFGHTIIADNFLLLQDLRRRGEVPAGSRLLLFTYGFGSSWCSLLLEH